MNPETRTSLLLRVRDPSNQTAWREFVEIYAPVILRLARFKGLQTADAEDMVQQVLISVAGAIERRPHDPQRARFRTWLNRVAENAILNAITRARPDQGTGRTDIVNMLAQHAASAEDSAMLKHERKQQAFVWAADRIRPEFNAQTWDAFWATAVEGETCESVADRLDKNIGSIYAARSRIMRRLKEKVADFDL